MSRLLEFQVARAKRTKPGPLGLKCNLLTRKGYKSDCNNMDGVGTEMTVLQVAILPTRSVGTVSTP